MANVVSNAVGIGRKEDYSLVTNHFSKNSIKTTKELLCFVTITPYKESKLFKSWQKVSKCSDYFRKISRVFFIVKGTCQDKTAHYHIIAYLTPNSIMKIKNSKQFSNVNIKERTVLSKHDFIQESPDEEFIDARDELIDEGQKPTDIDVWIRVGYNRRDLEYFEKTPKLDKYAKNDFSRYMLKNLYANTDFTGGWIEFENYQCFPRQKPAQLINKNTKKVVDFTILTNLLEKKNAPQENHKSCRKDNIRQQD